MIRAHVARRLFVLLVGVGLLLVTSASGAVGQQSQQASPRLTVPIPTCWVSPGPVRPAQKLLVGGNRWLANSWWDTSVVSIRYTDTTHSETLLGTASPAGKGSFSRTVYVPADATPGIAQVSFVGNDKAGAPVSCSVLIKVRKTSWWWAPAG